MRETARLLTAAGFSCLLVVAVAWTGAMAAPAEVQSGDAVISPQQIEADWLRQEVVRESTAGGKVPQVTPEQDAAGGCDGVKDGTWGFHTENEADPWWQVDLEKPTALERVVLWNRCDECAGRNAHIRVLLSDDGKTFRQAYQHDGTPFMGHSDKKPLSVPLKGAAAATRKTAFSTPKTRIEQCPCVHNMAQKRLF
ncbi:MAG: discoidin domain-containing protein [Phycisphaerae bacterium]